MLNQKDHGNDNWWTLSEGWPETTENAYSKWVFANKSNKLIPYGSYVISGNTLRVETSELLNKLNEHYNIVRKSILEEIENESDEWQVGDYVQYKWSEDGSVGILTQRRRYDDGFYVDWCHKNFNDIVYTSGSSSRKDLRKITKNEFDAIINKQEIK